MMNSRAHSSLPLQDFLPHAAARVGAKAIIAFQSARFTPFADVEGDLLLLAGYYNVPAPHFLYGLPCQCVVDWLLRDEVMPAKIHDPVADECWVRLLNKLHCDGYVKIVRGGPTDPWLSILFLSPDGDPAERRCMFERCATRLALRLFERQGAGDRGYPTRISGHDLEAYRSYANVHGVGSPSDVSVPEYLRYLLSVVLDIVRPDPTVGLNGSVYLFQERNASRVPPSLQNRSGVSSDLLDAISPLPIHELLRTTTLRESGSIELRRVSELGIFPADRWKDYGTIPINTFKLATNNRADGDKHPCILRHAALLGETYYLPDVGRDAALLTSYFPAFGDITPLAGGRSSNLVIPLIDRRTCESLGAVNVEGSPAAALLDPHSVALAQYVLHCGAEALVDAKRQSLRHFVHGQTRIILTSALRSDEIRSIAVHACNKLSRLYKSHVELYALDANSPIQSRITLFGHARYGAEEPPRYNLSEGLATELAELRTPHVIDPSGRISRIPLPLESSSKTTEFPEREHKRSAQPSIPIDEWRTTPLSTTLTKIVKGDYVFCSPIFAAHSASNAHRPTPWPMGIVVLGRPEAWPVDDDRQGYYSALFEIEELFMLVQRLRIQIVAMTGRAMEHEVLGDLLDGIDDVVTQLPIVTSDADIPGRARSYVRLCVSYLKAMLLSYTSSDGLGRPERLTIAPGDSVNGKHVTENDLSNLCICVKALVQAPTDTRHSAYLRIGPVDQALYPLLLSLRNLYSNAYQAAGDKAELRFDREEMKIMCKNGLNKTQLPTAVRELLHYPHGRLGKGRWLARELLAQHYSNITMDEGIARSTSTFVVELHLCAL